MTGLVILLKSDSNNRFFGPCDLEIWWMASKNNKAPFLYYVKFCASFQIHRWIQIAVTVWKHSIRTKIDLFKWVTLKFGGWPWKTIKPPFCTTSIFVHPFKLIGEFKLELQFRNTQFGAKLAFLCSVWPWNLMRDLEKQWGTSSILRQALCIISKPSVDSNWSYNTEIRSLGQNWRSF